MSKTFLSVLHAQPVGTKPANSALAVPNLMVSLPELVAQSHEPRFTLDNVVSFWRLCLSMIPTRARRRSSA
jgi:hypothetical protein